MIIACLFQLFTVFYCFPVGISNSPSAHSYFGRFFPLFIQPFLVMTDKLPRSSLSGLSISTPRPTSGQVSSSTRPPQRNSPSSSSSSSPLPFSSSLSSSSLSSGEHVLTESSRSRDENKEGRVDQAELLTALRSLFTSGSSSSSSGPGQLTLLQQAAGQRPASATTTNRAAPAVDTRSSLIDDKSNPLQPPSDSSSSTEERLAAKIVERATSMGSFTAWAQAQSFKSARNRNEVLDLHKRLMHF